MQNVLGKFLTEDKVKNILSSNLLQGEELEFIGHAFSHLWGFTYYVGKSENKGVTAQLFNGCHIHEPATMTMDAFEEFISKKKVEVFPFEIPPLQYEKDRAIFQTLKEAVESHLELEENFVTLCRASRFGLKNYLVGITDKRILQFKIKPKRKLEITGLESFPLSDVAELSSPYGPFGAELLPIRVPLIDGGNWIRIRFNDDKTMKYRITDVKGSVAGSSSGGA